MIGLAGSGRHVPQIPTTPIVRPNRRLFGSRGQLLISSDSKSPNGLKKSLHLSGHPPL